MSCVEIVCRRKEFASIQRRNKKAHLKSEIFYAPRSFMAYAPPNQETLDGLRYQVPIQSFGGGKGITVSEVLFIPSLRLELHESGSVNSHNDPDDSVGVENASNEVLRNKDHGGDRKILMKLWDSIRSEKLRDPMEYRPVKVNSASLKAIQALQAELDDEDTITVSRARQVKEMQKNQIEDLFAGL